MRPGEWLAAMLAADGFAWLRRVRQLRRQDGVLLHRIALQPSVFNRTGRSVHVATYVQVGDPALRRWRLAHPHLVAAATDSDVVCGPLLGYAAGRANGYVYGDAQDGDLELVDPARRRAVLSTFLAIVREGVLPWFAEASDPDTIVTSRAADYTNNPVGPIEWLASRDRLDLVDAYASRFRTRRADTGDRWGTGASAARNGHPNPNNGDEMMSMGWSVTTLTTR